MIRPEKPQDVQEIRRLVRAAFLGHPRHEPGTPPTEDRIVDQLRNSGALALSLVTVREGVIAGHVAFSPVAVEGRSGDWYGLGPLAVEAEQRGRGVGAELVEAGIALMKARGAFFEH